MTKFNRRVIRRFSLLALGLVGCAQQQASEATSEPVQVAVVTQPASNPGANLPPQLPAVQPQPKVEPKAEPPAAPPPTFAFPADLAGQGLARVVAPDITRPLPAERLGGAPRPRTAPAKVLDPDATARADYVPPTILPPKPASTKPAAPPEKLPVDLGAGADGIPAKPVLPVAAVTTERARDANLPPPPPVLGRPLADRVSLDDPTSEFGNAVVVSGLVRTPLGASGFLKAVVPDPFELAEHVKPKVPAAAEPSAAPVPVNPQRVK